METATVHEMQLNVSEFVEKRAAQIADLLAVVDNSALVAGEVTKGPRTAAQRLPRHMRRRAMSHDVRRMPRRFRAFARPYLERSKHRKKPPSRFARRRPRNLLLNYVRRQRKHVWLETHIWHAKRFHMKERWGYRIPDRSFQRAFRPIYRNTRRHAVIRDKSYLSCFLISAPSQDTLVGLLSPLCCPPTVSQSIRGVGGRDGLREINTLLYARDAYPHKLLGPARFQWSTSTDGRSQLSFWVHPSCRAVVLDELKSLLGVELQRGASADEEDLGKLSAPSNITEWRAARVRMLTDVYENEAATIKLEDLRDQLVRYRLIGPKSHRILAETLQLAQADDAYALHHAQWSEVFARCGPGQLMDGSVYSLLIEDPRCGRPLRRGLMKGAMPEPVSDPDSLDRSAPSSSLWDRQTRLDALEARIPNSAMNELRGSSLGGVRETPAKIPLLVVVRNSGRDTLNGVDVIVPSGYGSDLWVALQLRTARASGLRDECAGHSEAATPCFPFDAVDSLAGTLETVRQANEKEDRHLSRPWNRRPSFWSDLSVKYPFSFEWTKLIADWSEAPTTSENPPFVLRDRRQLETISQWMNRRQNKKGRGGGDEQVQELINKHPSAFVTVQLDCVARGRPRRLALICLPNEDDLVRDRSKKKRKVIVQGKRGEDEKKKVTEEEEDKMDLDNEDAEDDVIVDKAAQRRWQNEMWKDVVSTDAAAREKPISLKKMFPQALVSRERKRKLLNRKKKDRKKRRKLTAATRAAEAERMHKEMNEIKYRLSANREICGRVLRGDFSFTAARGRAIGLVPLSALPSIRSRRSTVLFRNTTSRYYHPATVSVSMTRLEL